MSQDPVLDLQIDQIDRGADRLRIAVVTETYPPEVNGVAMTLSRLVQALADRQHRVQLIRLRQPHDPSGPTVSQVRTGDVHKDILMRGVPIPRYPGLRMGLPCKGSLVKLWSVQRPDVVHIATEGPLGWSALRAAQQLKLPVSSDFRTNFHAYSRHYGLGVLLRSIMLVLRKFHNRADLTMVPTKELRGQLHGYGFRNLMVVGRGVDGEQFNPQARCTELRRQWGVPEGGLALVSLGRLAPEKNLDLTVSAFEAARRVRSDVRMVFIGDGPLRASLQARCPQAVFTGMLRGAELVRHVASGDLLLFPSETETFGNVVTEAMACGVPVLAYRMAAAAELISSGINGQVVEPGDEASYVRSAAELVMSGSLLRQLGDQARRDVAELDWRGIARQVELALLALVDQQRQRAMGAISLPSWAVRS